MAGAFGAQYRLASWLIGCAMIRSFKVTGFKSYKAATLPLAGLTVLIGANASGKSNLIEALQLLSWIARGRRLEDLLSALKDRELAVRGTTSNLTYGGSDGFGFECVVNGGPSGAPDLCLDLRMRVGDDGMHIREERLWGCGDETGFPLYQIEESAATYSPEIQVAYNDFAPGGKKPRIACMDQQAVFTQLTTPARFSKQHEKSQATIPPACELLRKNLEAVLFLDPVPGRMRDYSFMIDRALRGDGSNVSAVLFDLGTDPARKLRLLDFVRSVPEQDIADIGFLEGPRKEVMLRLEESFGRHSTWVDAPLLSDGTLRVLAVAAALLSVPEGSLVVIEEIDNGVHPSRAEGLLANIQAVAVERGLRVLLTTHNPALLDAIPLSAVPDIVACYRDPEDGDSRLVRLEDLERYPELVAQGRVGQLVTTGILDRFVKARPSVAAKSDRARQFLEDLSSRPSEP